jgi:N-acetyl-anhydromuramyl-L-alanine amidase AmpD
MKATIQLKNRSGSTSLAEMALHVSYFVNTDEAKYVPKTSIHFPLASSTVSQEFEEGLALDRDVFFVLILRSTNILAQASALARTLREEVPVVLEFDHKPVDLGEPEPEGPPPKPLFAYGRLLEKNGEGKMEDVQIIFEAKRAGENSLVPFASVRTEANGYFFIEYPEGEFTEAFARVGLDVVENPVSIRLEQGEPETKVFPRKIIVVVELVKDDAPASADNATCDCDGGCEALDVHEPKRVLEEYSFYSLVRTSEPEILGYILEDEAEISLADILNEHPVRWPEIIDSVVALPAFNTRRMISRTAPTMTGTASLAGDEELVKSLKNIKVNRSLLEGFLKSEGAITPANVVKLIDLNEALRFRKKITPAQPKPLGRVSLDASNTVDWDKEPTIYQSISVAHGHLLHFKSEWIADGYTLGDLLYSLPLAPGQKKQVVVFDWERRESAANMQSLDYEESLYNSLGRDRDIFEITKGTIQENISGKSSATTASASAGIGGLVGGILFGVSGGAGHSGSNSSQKSLRQTSASDMQRIRDRIIQSANAVRSQRSSVIQTVSQGERFEVSSETVANYNHCHAITIQYFEVLRHLKVRQRLADARECLFVPLLMSQFDLDKALRWDESLKSNLINGTLAKAFEAAERVKNQWVDSNFPSGTFASEKILHATGSFQIRFILRRPDDKLVEVDDTSRPIIGPMGVVGYHKKTIEDIKEENWQSLIPFLGAETPKGFYERYLRNVANKDDVFHRLLGEKIATSFVASLGFHVADETGNEISSMNFDVSLNSRYRKEGVLNISVRFMGPSQFSRDKVHYIKIRSGSTNTLPENSSITLESGFIRYKTNHYEGFLCRYQSIKDDLSPTDGVTLYAGPGADELRDPRKDDIASVNKLIDHLNDNLEYYHKAVWMRMSPERRFMLLDGIILPGPKGLGRSLASLVENDLIGIVGNSLVFPVAQGLNLDPNFGLSDSLIDYYMVSATDPVSISVPTKGVYAESMMGHCNSCEVKDESRFWRWEESPIPDSPTAINPISTESRRAEPGNLQPLALPNPMISIQNAPALPDPAGLAGTLNLLGKADSFRDITGLTENQKNAIEALKASFDTTKAFGSEAAKIEIQKLQEAAKLETQKMMDRRLDTAMSKIQNSGLDAEKKKELMEKALNAYLGAGAKQEDKPKTDQQKADGAKVKTEAIKDAVDKKVISPQAGEKLGAVSLQHSLFGASEEVTPGTIETQTLLGNPELADKEFEFENEAFRFAAKAAGGSGGGGSGSTTPAALQVTFVLINNIREADPVQGVTVNISGTSISVTNNTSNRVTADLASLADGDYTVEVVPRDVYTTGDFSDIGDPATSPPNRLWLPYNASITKQGNTFTSTDPRVTIQNRSITIRIMPMWMSIAAGTNRGSDVPTYIIVHHTDDENRGAYDANFHSKINRSINAWIANGFAPHYVIDRDGFVVKLGHESRAASHTGIARWDGQSSMNNLSIGIEIVHTNNVRNSTTPTYTEEYTTEQYESLIGLLNNLTTAWSIPTYNIIGHSDIATAGGTIPNTEVGRKSSDPGRKFDWTILEAADLGLLRDSAAVDFTVAYGGFFAAHPGRSIRAGEPGVTPAIVTELKNDLTRIGYSVTSTNVYDRSVRRAMMVFGEHFLSIDGLSSVDQNTAEVIKKVVAHLAGVKP